MPKRMAVPLTVPLILVGTLFNPEIVIEPPRLCPDSCHVSLKVPLKDPLQVPDHFPERDACLGRERRGCLRRTPTRGWSKRQEPQ